jgi:uncharacterized protein (DUF2249 family)/iron-sulfur cluster repair protein YtfE (RIC family)
MTDVLFSSTEADAAAARAIEEHHAELSGALAALVATLVTAADDGEPAALRAGQENLLRWAREELLPHAAAEEQTLYPAGAAFDRGRLLIDGMVAEHATIGGLVHELAAATDGVRAAAAARALSAVFDSHLHKENELLLPLLTAAPGVSLAGLLEGMHAGSEPDAWPGGPAAEAHGDHACGCGHADEPGYPELDARVVPHAIRHATIFGALGAVPDGGGLLLLAPHDPLPLLAQIEQRWPGAFEVGYVERGPETWRLAFVRVEPA